MKGFLYALRGLREGLATQVSMKIHLLFTIIVIGAGYFLKIETAEWYMIIFCIGLVFTIELINTAIEYLVNFISPEYHEKAGKIKDLAAAGVLMSVLTSVTVGLIVFMPRIMFLIKYF